MNNKIFYIEYKSMTSGEMYYREEKASYILNGDVALDDMDYTLILEDYVEFLSDGDGELVYWELYEEDDSDEYIRIEMKDKNTGTLELKSHELGCKFRINKADVYYIEKIAEWVIERYPIYEALRELDELNAMVDVEALYIRIEKVTNNDCYKMNGTMSVLEREVMI